MATKACCVIVTKCRLVTVIMVLILVMTMIFVEMIMVIIVILVTTYFDNIVDVGDDSDVGRGDHDNYFVIVIVSKSVDVGGKIQPALQGEPQLHGCLIVRHVRGDLSTRDEYDGEENNDTIAYFSLKTQTTQLTRIEHIYQYYLMNLNSMGHNWQHHTNQKTEHL